MSITWTPQRIKMARIGIRTAEYEGIPSTIHESLVKQAHPELFKFTAISIGDNSGQAFLVPLDESSKETADYILRAIAAYTGE